MSAEAENSRHAPLKREQPPSLANKSARLLWAIAWLLLFRPSPRPLHTWRRLLLRCFGARIGRKAMPYPSAKIWAPWLLEMGDYSTLGDYCDCYSVARIKIGAYAVVSQRAFLCTATRDIDDPEKPLMTSPIEICDHAWVAAEAYVGPGVRVGKGGVVAARAVTLRDVAPWTVVAGHPASFIRNRQIAPKA